MTEKERNAKNKKKGRRKRIKQEKCYKLKEKKNMATNENKRNVEMNAEKL